MRYSLVLLALANSALTVALDLRPGSTMPEGGMALVAILVICFALVCVRRGEVAARRHSILVASVFLFPLLLALICIYLAFIVLFVPWLRDSLMAILIVPIFGAGELLLSRVGIPYLALGTASLVFAWRYRSLDSIAELALRVYTAVLILFLVFVTGWHVGAHRQNATAAKVEFAISEAVSAGTSKDSVLPCSFIHPLP